MSSSLFQVKYMQMNRLQYRSLRLVFSVSFSSYKDLLKTTHINAVQIINFIKIAKVTIQILINLSPSYILDYYCFKIETPLSDTTILPSFPMS